MTQFEEAQYTAESILQVAGTAHLWPHQFYANNPSSYECY
jgi:hypothetical protein